MNSTNAFRGAHLLSLLIAWASPPSLVHADGIPEPSLVLYGVVRDTATAQRITYGTMQWTFRPPSGPPVIVTTQLTNLHDQFSYVLFVPAEFALAGQPATSNTLILGSTPISYDRSEVRIDGSNATVLPPALTTLTLNLTDRGRLERVDLSVTGSTLDSDGNGLPDAWEMAYFGAIGVDPEGDPDGDGLNTRDEWKAGTSPNDPQSLFRFIQVSRAPSGAVTIEWSSATGKIYTVLRSSTLTGSFTPIRSGIQATPPVNSIVDNTPAAAGSFFYRLQLEE